MTHDNSFTRGRTRHQTIKPDEFDQSQPRIGRRESEPHSFEISYLHDVLTFNFNMGKFPDALHRKLGSRVLPWG